MAAETLRSVHNDGDEDAVLVITSVQAGNYDGEVELQDDFWPE